MRKRRLFWALILNLLLGSCMLVVGPIESIIEPFDEADRPAFDVVSLDEGTSYKLQKPWNYDKSWNRKRRYPLIVSLHGSGGSYYAPCIVNDDEEMQAYPCFFMSPHNASGWGSSSEWVWDEIERLADAYRINPYRIYLMGFSMGGSGSYTFANLYYDKYKRLFAGIVRLAGSYVETLDDAIMGNTSIWYHIGTADGYDLNGSKADTAFANIQNYEGNAGAVESSATDTVGGYERVTRTLTLDGVEIMKLSKYTGMGHDGGTAFQDPGVLDWLFSQSLANR